LAQVVEKGNSSQELLRLILDDLLAVSVAVMLARPLHVSKDGQSKEKGKTEQATLTG